jgi:hypothetical protein
MTALVVRHIVGLVGLVIPALVVRDTMDREVRHTKGQEVLSIVVRVALPTMAPVVRHIQVQAVPATRVRAVLAIRALVDRVKTALRYADDTYPGAQADLREKPRSPLSSTLDISSGDAVADRNP